MGVPRVQQGLYRRANGRLTVVASRTFQKELAIIQRHRAAMDVMQSKGVY